MKWGILATGKIAKKFAETILQMEEEGEMKGKSVRKEGIGCITKIQANF